MPTNTTRKTTAKNEKSTLSTRSKSTTKSSTKKTNIEKKEVTKKVVVKRRKHDLTPTRASAAAIASQANRAQKEALIRKLATEENVSSEKRKSVNMIPLWVWVFFGCALLLFCVSFYQAIIRPQLEKELTEANLSNNTYEKVDSDNSVSLGGSSENQQAIENDNNLDKVVTEEYLLTVPTGAVDTIEEFFRRLSVKQFDAAYDLFTPSLQRSSEIREHFTSFRMNPFVSGIEGELKPTNFQYVSTSTYGKDRYSFDLSYTLAGSQETFDEAWEFVVDTSGDEPKISSLICTTTKCSRHPIFWPESFGLMR